MGITARRCPRRAIIDSMSDDKQRQGGATTPDLPRQATTSDESEYSLSIEEALARYEVAGLPRTTRSIQRYCAKGDLDAHRIETPFGEKFLITPASVERHIAYINEVRLVATSRGLSRQVATTVAGENKSKSADEGATTTTDNPRRAATTADMSQPVAPQSEPVSQPVAVETGMIDLLKSENAFLKGQVAVKDEQIKDLTERARETNHLIGGLQRMLTPLLGNGAPTRDNEGRRATYAEELDDRPQ